MDAASDSTGSSPTARVPRWASLSVVLVFVALGLRVLGHVRVLDLDLFHEMALVREALALGFLPREDLFAYTSTVSPSIHHEWGAGLVFYVVTMGLGAGGLAILRVVLLAAVAFFCWRVARTRGAEPAQVALVAPLAILLFWPGVAPVRAHMFTFLLLAVLLWCLETDRRGSRTWLFLWPALYVVWLNLHGGFVVGAGLLGVYTLESFVRSGRSEGWSAAWAENRHLVFATVITLPLTLVNPYGLDYVPYMWNALVLERPSIPEWAPLWSPGFRGAPLLLFAASLAVVLYTLLRGEGWKKAPGLLVVLVAAVFALRSIRILPIYVITLVCYVPAALSTTPLSRIVQGLWRRHARPIGAAALLLAVVGMWRVAEKNPLVLELPTEPGAHLQTYPAGAVAYLSDAGFVGNLMTPFGVGAYVSWHLYPDVKVGLDSRYEVAYEPGFVEEAMGVYAGRGNWREFLGRYPTDALLVATDSPLDSLLVQHGRAGAVAWTERYRDDAYAVFARPDVAAALPRVDRRGEPIPGSFP